MPATAVSRPTVEDLAFHRQAPSLIVGEGVAVATRGPDTSARRGCAYSPTSDSHAPYGRRARRGPAGWPGDGGAASSIRRTSWRQVFGTTAGWCLGARCPRRTRRGDDGRGPGRSRPGDVADHRQQRGQSLRIWILVCLAVSMPKTPSGHKRSANVVSNAVHVMKIATGEIEESETTDDGKNRAAVELGRKGGAARAAALTKARRKAIATKAAQSRWIKRR